MGVIGCLISMNTGGGVSRLAASLLMTPRLRLGWGGGVMVVVVESAMPRRLQICNPSGHGEGSQWEQWAAAAVM